MKSRKTSFNNQLIIKFNDYDPNTTDNTSNQPYFLMDTSVFTMAFNEC